MERNLVIGDIPVVIHGDGQLPKGVFHVIKNWNRGENAEMLFPVSRAVVWMESNNVALYYCASPGIHRLMYTCNLELKQKKRYVTAKRKW